MTKIFEALENAGLERYNLQDQQAIAVPIERAGGFEVESIDKRTVDAAELRFEKTINNLYQNIVMKLPVKKGRVVQLQATQVAEGTSTLTRELAKVAAIKFRKSVLLLDLNQGKQNQCSYFGVKSEFNWMDKKFDPEKGKENFARFKNTSLYITHMSTNSSHVNNVCEMPEAEQVLEKVRYEFDLVLIDSPSAVSCTECLLLAPNVDGVVLVVKAGKTRWQTVDKVKKRILDQDGNILGVVLNKRRYPIPNFIYKRI